jgi:DNA mismatch repair protein MutS
MANGSPDVIKQTPMIRQYLEQKQAYPDCILFFRLGDFYEMFFEDAELASRVLDLTLTSRSKGDDAVAMCGVPYFSANGYIAKLVEQGYKVAVCDQVEDPKLAKGIVRREVVRVVSPGMIVDPDDLNAKESNYLGAIVVDDSGRAGFAFLDVSTADFRLTEVENRQALFDELARVRPRELLVPASAERTPLLDELQGRFRSLFIKSTNLSAEQEDVRRPFFAIFSESEITRAGLRALPLGLAAAAVAFAYAHASLPKGLDHVRRIVPYQVREHVVIDEASVANLELLRTLMEGHRQGSLLDVLDRTRTPMGARRLRDWLLFPLVSVERIRERVDAVSHLVEDGVARHDLRERLSTIRDLERLLGKISAGQANPRDLGALRASLRELPAWREVVERQADGALPRLVGPIDCVSELVAVLDAAFVDEPPTDLDEGGAIRPGYHARLDELQRLSTSGRDIIAQLEQQERRRTGIGSLKIRYNRVFGYYIEVTKPNLHLVPQDYRRKQTTANAERFETAELKAQEEAVLTAQEERVALEQRLFDELVERVRQDADRILRVAWQLSVSDALAALAEVAAHNGYCRPVVDEHEQIEIRDGRHPVVERMLVNERFVPNDLQVDCEREQLLVITGPNMAGKSTVIRQTALIVIMAQMGSFVPAAAARIGLVDRIFTRIGAADNLARGQSTFMVEMTETAQILRHATRRSLLILDEIGRGTSTFDGVSIAWAVAEYIHDRIGSRTLFATHYHQLADLALTKSRVVNYTISVKEWRERIIFLRRLVKGISSRSYGIQVGKLAGLPEEVIGRAQEILANLEGQEYDELGAPRLSRSLDGSKPPSGQMQLFGETHPRSEVEEELAQIDLDTLTPLDALTILHRWKGT